MITLQSSFELLDTEPPIEEVEISFHYPKLSLSSPTHQVSSFTVSGEGSLGQTQLLSKKNYYVNFATALIFGSDYDSAFGEWVTSHIEFHQKVTVADLSTTFYAGYGDDTTDAVHLEGIFFLKGLPHGWETRTENVAAIQPATQPGPGIFYSGTSGSL